jgi:hypothetical protein
MYALPFPITNEYTDMCTGFTGVAALLLNLGKNINYSEPLIDVCACTRVHQNL